MLLLNFMRVWLILKILIAWRTLNKVFKIKGKIDNNNEEKNAKIF